MSLDFDTLLERIANADIDNEWFLDELRRRFKKFGKEGISVEELSDAARDVLWLYFIRGCKRAKAEGEAALIETERQFYADCSIITANERVTMPFCAIHPERVRTLLGRGEAEQIVSILPRVTIEESEAAVPRTMRAYMPDTLFKACSSKMRSVYDDLHKKLKVRSQEEKKQNVG